MMWNSGQREFGLGKYPLEKATPSKVKMSLSWKKLPFPFPKVPGLRWTSEGASEPVFRLLPPPLVPVLVVGQRWAPGGHLVGTQVVGFQPQLPWMPHDLGRQPPFLAKSALGGGPSLLWDTVFPWHNLGDVRLVDTRNRILLVFGLKFLWNLNQNLILFVSESYQFFRCVWVNSLSSWLGSRVTIIWEGFENSPGTSRLETGL